MGTHWGISRSVAQIHALLYVVGRPMTADEIVETLDIARSNVGTGLKELQAWGLVKVRQKLGDRRDYFETFDDVWESFRVIIKARKHREIRTKHPGNPRVRCRGAREDFKGLARSGGNRLSAMLNSR